MEFKDRINQARKAKGLSQEELAEKMGVSRQAVSKWETGEAMPDMEKLIALCQTLDLTLEYLALGKESPKEQIVYKTRRWLTVLVSTVCLLSGLLIGYFLPDITPSPLTHTPESSDPIVYHSNIQQNVLPITPTSKDSPVSNVIVTPIPGYKTFQVAVLPRVLTEEMEIELLIEDLLYEKSQTLPCTFDGNYFCVNIHHEDIFDYRITAILTTNGAKSQIPILDIDCQGNGLSYTKLYE